MVEFEDSFSERMAQLDQEDFERYQRDIRRNSNNQYADENPSYDDEFQSKLNVLMDLVRGCINDLHRTPSSTVNGSESSAMNIQPVSLINDDVAIYNHSDLGSESTDEHPDEVMAVNELPDSAEMMDFDGIQGNESSNSEIVIDLKEYKVSESSINSHSLVNPSHQKQLTLDSGLKVLSIYCAHMATKWSPVLDSQPIQGNEMSVVVYYDRFCDWKKKLDEVDYIGGEESYIDDFLYGLKRELAVRIWEYKWKPQTLYGAFRRAVIEETMVKNDADKVLKETPHPNSIDRGADNVSDKYSNVVLDASLGSKFTVKSSLLEKDSEPIQLLLQKFVGHNEGKVADGGVVLSLFDLQAYLRPLGDLSMNGSDNGSTKAFSVSEKYVIEDDAYRLFGEITQAFRAALLDEEVMNHSAKYVDFNKLILFDPGGSRKCVMSFRREATRLLFGKAQGMVVWGFEGVTSTHRHANSFLYTSHRNSQQTLFHDMDKYNAAMMILGALKGLKGEMVHMFVFTHPEDVVPASLSIQRVHFKLAGKALLALAYIDHMAYTLLGNNLSYQNAVVRRITHKNFHLLEQLHVGLMNKIMVLIVTEVSHLSEVFGATKYYLRVFYPGTKANVVKLTTNGVQINLQCIGPFFVEILAYYDRCRPFDPGGNLLSQLEGQCALFDYILEDKEIFERVGKDILLMNSRLVIMSNWCNDSDTHCLLNGVVNTLLSPLEYFQSASINFQVCRTKSAFICLRPILQMVVWCVLNNSIMTSSIKAKLDWPVILVDSQVNRIRVALILSDHTETIQQAGKVLYGMLFSFWILVFQLISDEACPMNLKLAEVNIDQPILVALPEYKIVYMKDLSEEQSSHKHVLLQALSSRHVIPYSLQLGVFEPHHQVNLMVHLQELDWMKDYNKSTKSVFRDLFEDSLIDVFKYVVDHNIERCPCDDFDVHSSRLAWSFFSTWLHVMRNVLFAASRKHLRWSCPYKLCFLSLWLCLNRNGKCRDFIPHLIPKSNCSMDEYLQHMRLTEAYLKYNDGAPYVGIADTRIYSKCTDNVATKQEHYLWDPDCFVPVSQLLGRNLMWNFHFTTLRTRRFLRGRSCHEWQFYYNFICISGFIVFSGL